MTSDSHSSDERRLWERFAGSVPGPPAACPAELDLAAWIDGHATGPAARTVEEHLADCADCRETVAAIRRDHAEVAGRLVTAPPEVVAAAKLLVAARPGLRLTPALGPLGWGLAAAASIAICVVGYQVGSARPMPGAASADEVLLSEMSFGLLNGNDDGLLLALEEVTP